MFVKKSPGCAVHMYCSASKYRTMLHNLPSVKKRSPAHGRRAFFIVPQRSLMMNTESGVDSTFKTPPISHTTLFCAVAVVRARNASLPILAGNPGSASSFPGVCDRPTCSTEPNFRK